MDLDSDLEQEFNYDSNLEQDSDYSLDYFLNTSKDSNYNIRHSFELPNHKNFKCKVVYFRINCTEIELQDLTIKQKFQILCNELSIIVNNKYNYGVQSIYNILSVQTFYGNEIICRESDILVPIFCDKQQHSPFNKINIIIFGANHTTFFEKMLDNKKLFLIKWKPLNNTVNSFLTINYGLRPTSMYHEMVGSGSYVSKYKLYNTLFNMCFITFTYIPYSCSGDDDYYIDSPYPTNIEFNSSKNNEAMLNFDESDIFQFNFFGIKSYLISLYSSVKNFEDITKTFINNITTKNLSHYIDLKLSSLVAENNNWTMTITTEQEVNKYQLECSVYIIDHIYDWIT